MKWFHNGKVSLAWAVGSELVAHLFFAFQAFLLGSFLGDIALRSVFGAEAAKLIGAWGLAIFIFGAAFQAFVLGQYMAEDVEAYERIVKVGKYRRAWKQVTFIVGGLEISSLTFRTIQVVASGDYIQAVVIVAFGSLSLWYAFAQAKVIHAAVNRPAAHDVMRARNSVGRELVAEAMDKTKHMTTEQKLRFYRNDLTVVDEVQTPKFMRRQEKMLGSQRERQQREQSDQEYELSQQYASQILEGPQDAQPFLKAVPTDQANGNGNRRNA